MNSPFPGMDPYLEKHWRDVHHHLITYTHDQIQGRLPSDLRARVEERMFVDADVRENRGIYPEVRVVERGSTHAVALAAETDIALAEPLVIRLGDEPASQGFIEIIDVGSGNRLVTVIEFISPSNKVPGRGQDLYFRKQEECIAAGVSLVEIDLTRTGERALSYSSYRIPPSHRTTYQICVRRGYESGAVEVYRVPLEEPLPAIRIPLRETDPDVPLQIQPLIDQCYRNGRYDDLDYKADPVPPLNASDAAWADELLRSMGLR
ncbi:MAG: DUF4058 family protein [Planctomycetota bacterium]|nr:DUF4058 family protein [Planctomycetota bacterium]